MANNCFYCENGEKLHSLMIPVVELEHSIVYLNRDQKHKGRCIVRLKEHLCEYHEMTKEQCAGYFAEVARTGKAIQALYNPDKINYATFGDLVPHVHIHMVPKYKDGLHWGAPFSDDMEKVLLNQAEYEAMVKALKDEIEKNT